MLFGPPARIKPWRWYSSTLIKVIKPVLRYVGHQSAVQWCSKRNGCTLRALIACLVAAGIQVAPGLASEAPGWSNLPVFEFRVGLKAFWNVGAKDDRIHAKAAEAHGFSSLTILNTFDDYPGRQQRSILKFLGSHNANPWVKPEYFEEIVKRNIERAGGGQTIVHDIEFHYQHRPALAFYFGAARKMLGSVNLKDFERNYWREWATWVTKPARWTKERFPNAAVGIYGFQPFFTDSAKLLDASDAAVAYYHYHDLAVWRHIESSVDFVVASAYIDSDDPVWLYRTAFEIEMNHQRERELGDKPIYAYLWLRHNNRDWQRAVSFLGPQVVEAMAILPYFSGAKGTVLWGYEPQVRVGDPLPYAELGTYVRALARVADISDLIGKGRLIIDATARELWKRKKPIIRKFELANGQCVAMAVDPWQDETAVTSVNVYCSGHNFAVPLNGRHTTLAVFQGGRMELK